MNYEKEINYYSVIPATVRYCKELKANEKILYSEITALANKNGYCYAQNKYFAELYNVTTHTVSQWVSHIQSLGFIEVEIIKNEKKQFEGRRIYIKDIHYVQKNTYPYVLNSTYPMYKKVQHNNIKYNIDDLFILIINKDNKISQGFFDVLHKLDLDYTEEILQYFRDDKKQVIKNIIYVLYEIYNSNFKRLITAFKRETLINLYFTAEEHSPNDILTYYKRTLINKYTNNST